MSIMSREQIVAQLPITGAFVVVFNKSAHREYIEKCRKMNTAAAAKFSVFIVRNSDEAHYLQGMSVPGFIDPVFELLAPAHVTDKVRELVNGANTAARGKLGT